jgi:hypothetical protein
MSTSHIECLYCASPITTRTSAVQMTCVSCRKNLIDEFGERWYEQPWHREMLPDYVKFQHETDRLFKAVRLDAEDAPEIATDDVVIPGTPSRVKYPSVYAAVFQLYAISKLGARKIKQQLDAQGVQPVVSLPTVSNYLKLVKTALAAADERLEVRY